MNKNNNKKCHFWRRAAFFHLRFFSSFLFFRPSKRFKEKNPPRLLLIVFQGVFECMCVCVFVGVGVYTLFSLIKNNSEKCLCLTLSLWWHKIVDGPFYLSRKRHRFMFIWNQNTKQQKHYSQFENPPYQSLTNAWWSQPKLS